MQDLYHQQYCISFTLEELSAYRRFVRVFGGLLSNLGECLSHISGVL